MKAVLAIALLGSLLLAGLAAVARYLFQEPARIALGRLAAPEIAWHGGKYPSLRPLFAVAEALVPEDPLTQYAMVREVTQPLGVGSMLGPQPAWASLPVCYDAAGRPQPVAGVAPPRLGALRCVSPGPPTAIVGTTGELVEAMRAARPGDHILLRPGSYEGIRSPIVASMAGTPLAPIFLRAERPGTAVLRSTSAEGLLMMAPHWVVENLTFEGSCDRHQWCEHAIHVVGPARGVVLRNLALREYNSALKVNGRRGEFPDDGLVEGVIVANTTPRETDRPATMIDIVTADRWIVRRSVLTDSAKRHGDGVSYAGFMKGGGRGGIFEQNLVLCRWRHRGGTRVGLSMGGGGTGRQYCRDGDCGFEHQGGVIRNNVVAGCSDAGIYLNKGADTRIENNLLYATRGIDARFAATTATIRNNIVDGRIVTRDGARVDASENLTSRVRAVLLSSVAEAELADPAAGALAFRSAARAEERGAPLSGPADDLCGRPRDPNAPGIGPFANGRADCISGVQLR